MKRRIALALIVVVVLFLTIPAIVRSPQPTENGTRTLSPLSPLSAPIGGSSLEDQDRSVPGPAPFRDLYSLTARLRPNLQGPVPRVVNEVAPKYTEGQKQVFWLADLEEYRHFTVTTTLRHISPHAYFYVQDGTDVSDDEVLRGAKDFEEIIYPSNNKYFGSEWVPGVDNDPHLSIVTARVSGAGGYYSVSDEYPRAVNPYSNEREIIYLGFPGARPGTRTFAAILAHEYGHAIHWNEQPTQGTWISEGIAELASVLAGFDAVGIPAFLKTPDTQVTAWSDEPGGVHRYYGAAHLFMKYLFQKYGGYESIRDFMAEREQGAEGITSYLKKKGFGVDFDGVFKDWVVANYLDEPGNGRYSYPDDNIKVATENTIKEPTDISSTVSQYGTDYYDIEIPLGDALIKFDGEPTARIVANDPHGGRFQWWSNRGDGIDSTLTREFDLSGLRTATLKFWTWYDIEEKWDHAYVEASTDGGLTWKTLPGRHTSKDDPIGNSFGNGLTGKSGGRNNLGWVEESIDLSAYAGKPLLLRFEYITDEGLNKSGIAIDDLTIPELGFRDDAEGDAGWKAEGFVRTTNLLKQRYAVQIIKSGRNGNSVEMIELNDGQDGQAIIRGFGGDLRKATIAISGLTPVTTQPAPYRLSVTASR